MKILYLNNISELTQHNYTANGLQRSTKTAINSRKKAINANAASCMLIINANAKVRADNTRQIFIHSYNTGAALVIVRHLILMKHGKNKSLVVPFMTAGQVGKGRGAAGEGGEGRVGSNPQARDRVLYVCVDGYPYSRWRKKGFISKWQ